MPRHLHDYHRKRAAERTPEPIGRPGALRPGLFVVHLHAARRTHYDLRLEWGGVLRCWAVPKGPSLAPADKRLAVQTEDHPVEYGEFEGIIPAGNYGAGATIVWDRGLWVPLLDLDQGMQTGKQLFELRGYKLRGRFTLVRGKKDGKDWLLIKERDAWATGEDVTVLPPESVLSGLTVEELGEGRTGVARLVERAAAAGAPRRALAVGDVQPMLATAGGKAFSGPGWVFELKYDGYRVLAGKGGRGHGAGGEPRLLYRSGRDATATYPEIARALAALPAEHLILDGEIVVLDDDGRPRFEGLQQRSGLSRPADVERAAIERPATYFVFDLLALEGHDLRPLPLAARKALLADLVPQRGPVRYADHVAERGEELFAAVSARGLEGLIAKRADSPYRAGRHPVWLKLRADKTGDFAVVGYTEPKGSRAGFGALQLAARATADAAAAGAAGAASWVWVGRVGSGFTERQLAELVAAMEGDRRAQAVCEVPKELAKGSTWVAPRLVVEVRYSEMTTAGQLRQPVFLRLREDKTAEECWVVEEENGPLGETSDEPAPLSARTTVAPGLRPGRFRNPDRAPSHAPSDEPPPVAPPPAERPPLQLTRLDKVFWPADGYTKGDLLDYYRTIAPHLLPYLRDRPLVLDRYPDGIAGKNFFQKNAPSFLPAWLRTEAVWSDDKEEERTRFRAGRRSGRGEARAGGRGQEARQDAAAGSGGAEERAFIADDLETLLYLVNLGAIPLHLTASRATTLERPDWCILDLDAKDAPFAAAVKVAKALRRICERLELPVYLKTSGASGLHLLVPLGARGTHEQAKHLALLLSRLAAAELPDLASVARLPGSRSGKVYVDALQNGLGKLLVAPYSVRPRPRAPVSTPLEWKELSERLVPADFNLKTVPKRLARLKRDPLRPVLEEAADIPRALVLLEERFG